MNEFLVEVLLALDRLEGETVQLLREGGILFDTGNTVRVLQASTHCSENIETHQKHRTIPVVERKAGPIRTDSISSTCEYT